MSKKKSEEIKKGEIIIFKTKDGPEIDVRLVEDSVWLDAHLIGKLFEVDRTVVVKHVGNIYKSKELNENSTCAKIAQVAADGKIRKMNLYNLDMIISIGYRVNSKRATQFRIWATKTLKNHLVDGYTINEKRLLSAQNKFNELTETIEFLKEKSSDEFLVDQQHELLSLLSSYSKTLSLLEQYDDEKLSLVKKENEKYKINYDDASKVLRKIKEDLVAKKEASDIFGQEAGDKFKGILGNIYQTFGGVDLYPSLEEKAAHLLYFVIKDHPFNDGNKRIGSFLFIYYLDRNNFLYKKSSEKKINDNALVTLALLIAISDPKEKEKMIKIITNLLLS
jgi:prophage maintenance system killer protein